MFIRIRKNCTILSILNNFPNYKYQSKRRTQNMILIACKVGGQFPLFNRQMTFYFKTTHKYNYYTFSVLRFSLE